MTKTVQCDHCKVELANKRNQRNHHENYAKYGTCKRRNKGTECLNCKKLHSTKRQAVYCGCVGTKAKVIIFKKLKSKSVIGQGPSLERMAALADVIKAGFDGKTEVQKLKEARKIAN